MALMEKCISAILYQTSYLEDGAWRELGGSTCAGLRFSLQDPRKWLTHDSRWLTAETSWNLTMWVIGPAMGLNRDRGELLEQAGERSLVDKPLICQSLSRWDNSLSFAAKPYQWQKRRNPPPSPHHTTPHLIMERKHAICYPPPPSISFVIQLTPAILEHSIKAATAPSSATPVANDKRADSQKDERDITRVVDASIIYRTPRTHNA